jgi:hypothetical protein
MSGHLLDDATAATTTAAAGIGLSTAATAAATSAAAGIGLQRALVATKRFKMQIIKIRTNLRCRQPLAVYMAE